VGTFLFQDEGSVEVLESTPTLGLKRPSDGGKCMPRGTVKWFNEKKGYGFITPDEGGQDLFVHHSSIEGEGFKTLRDGQTVEYEVGQGQKGPAAINVRPS